MPTNPFASSCFSDCLLGKGVRITHQSPIRMTHMEIRGNIRVGAFTYFRGGSIRKLKEIGSFCAVAPGVRIGDGQHPLTYLSTHPFQWRGWGSRPGESPEYESFLSETKPPPEPAQTEIGSDVWIGGGAIVTKDVLPYEVVAGVPAKHLKFRFDAETIQRLLAIRWWDYTLDSLSGLTFEDIHRCLDELEKRASRGELVPRNGTWFQHDAG